MRLISLTLNNFKGIKSFALKPQGKDINIYGDNATGKTTLADAFMWLLFDKDSQNRKDFQIKTLGQDGEPEHGLEHSVEAVLELENGKRITLKKVFKEKWTKKRGSATAEFTGHTTDHFIDGVPAKKKEYDEKIAEIADEQIFRLLTDPAYFNQQLHWQKRRELLLEVCGDVSDAEVIASKADLSKLADILGNRTIDLNLKQLEPRHPEFAVDFVLQKPNLSPNKFLGQIQLLFKILIFRSQLPFFCFQFFDTLQPVFPGLKPRLSLFKCCDVYSDFIYFLLNLSDCCAGISLGLPDLLFKFFALFLQLDIFLRRLDLFQTVLESLHFLLKSCLFLLKSALLLQDLFLW
jgi:predicted ATP-dependent endonuclease of OLD family